MICVNKKIVLAGGLLVGILFLFLIVASLPRPTPKAGGQPVPESTRSAQVALNRLALQGKTPERLNNDQTAALLLQWANNTRTEKGGYASGEDCDREGVCQSLVVNNGVGAVAMWAQFQSYLKHKSFTAADIVKEDIETYADPEKVTTIQPYFWSCRLIYELWQHPYFSQREKDGLQTICARSIYSPIDLVPRVDSTDAQTVIGQVKADLSGEAKQETFFSGPPDSKNLDEYAVNASERAVIYAWGKDPSDLEQAKLYFVAAVTALRNTADRITAADKAPLVAVAALDLNAVMPAREFLTYAQTVYTRYKGTACSTVQSCVLRAYFYNELYKLDKNAEYKAERDAIIVKLYDSQFDYQGTPGYFAGKQALYDRGLNYNYDMIPNTLLAGLLLNIQ